MSAKSGFKTKTLVYTLIGFNLLAFNINFAQAATCQAERDSERAADKRLKDACTSAGQPAGCRSAAVNCDNVIKEESFDTMGMIFEALGLPKTATATQQQNACPQLFGKQWYDERKRLQDSLKDANNDIAELTNEKAEVQDEYNKTTNDLQEQLTKAQEEYKQTEEDLNEEQRKMLAEFNNSQNQAKENMRNLTSKILQIEGEIITVQRQKVATLLTMTNSGNHAKCMAKTAEAKAENEKLFGAKGNSARNHVTQAKQKSTLLNETYQSCMKVAEQDRINFNEQTKNKLNNLEKQKQDAQSSLDEVQNSLNLAASQLEEMKQSIANKKSNALQSVVDLGTRIQNQLQAAYQKLQTQLQSLAQKEQNLNQELNRIQNELAALGSNPPSGSGSSGGESISAAVEAYESAKSALDSCTGGGSGSGGGSSSGSGDEGVS